MKDEARSSYCCLLWGGGGWHVKRARSSYYIKTKTHCLTDQEMSGTSERMVIHIGTRSFHLGRTRSIIRSRFDKLSLLSGTVFFKI